MGVDFGECLVALLQLVEKRADILLALLFATDPLSPVVDEWLRCLPAVWGQPRCGRPRHQEWDPSGPCWCSTTSCNTGAPRARSWLRSHEVLGRSYLRSCFERPLLINSPHLDQLHLTWVHSLASVRGNQLVDRLSHDGFNHRATGVVAVTVDPCC